jgi:hypothetical protein
LRYRCTCCNCHTLALPNDAQQCTLCLWNTASPDPEYTLTEARDNTRQYGVYYRPTDTRFAPSRHPILGASGEYAIDRVALRERAYREFAIVGASAGDSAKPTPRLLALLACISNADRLYVKR